MAGPRYSIVAGDFAEDARADVSHFRVYLIIGRHSDEEGWCRLKQITIGKRIGLSRETVNRKIKDLVEWGYVTKRAVDARGRAYWYRTIMDRGDAPAPQSEIPVDDTPDDELPDAGDANASANEEQNAGDAMHDPHGSANLDVSRASHLEFRCDGDLTPGVSAEDHTTCDRTPSHQNDLSLTTKKSTPTPQAGLSGVDDDQGDDDTPAMRTAVGKAERAIEALRADRPRPTLVIDRLLEPLIAARRFSAEDHAEAMRDIAKRAAGLSEQHLAKVLDIVLAAKVQVVKAQRVFDAIAAVRKGGLMLVVQRGSAEFAAWLQHYEKTNPPIARLMAGSLRWQVPAPFPPANSERAA